MSVIAKQYTLPDREEMARILSQIPSGEHAHLNLDPLLLDEAGQTKNSDEIVDWLFSCFFPYSRKLPLRGLGIVLHRRNQWIDALIRDVEVAREVKQIFKDLLKE